MRVSASQAGIISLCVYSNASNIENLTTKPCFFVYLRFDAAMERRHLQQATGGGSSSRNVALPARSISSGHKPPRLTTSTASKKQRQSFVASLPRPTAPPGGGLHQPSTGGGLHQPSTGGGQRPLPGGGYHQSNMKTPMPSISEPSRLPSLPQVSMSSFGHAADWDTQSASSTPALDYEATVDDFSAPNLFDWTPTQVILCDIDLHCVICFHIMRFSHFYYLLNADLL